MGTVGVLRLARLGGLAQDDKLNPGSFAALRISADPEFAMHRENADRKSVV